MQINYPNGTMFINSEEFFPCPKVKLLKLMKIVGMNYYTECQEKGKEILNTLSESLENLDEVNTLKLYANEAVSAKTAAGEMQDQIDKQAAVVEKGKKLIPQMVPASRKYARERLKEEKEKLKTLKAKQKSLMAHYRYYDSEFKKVKSKAQKYRDNIEIVKQFLTEWE